MERTLIMTIKFSKIISSDLSLANDSFNFNQPEHILKMTKLSQKLSALTLLSEEFDLPRDMRLLDEHNLEKANGILQAKVLKGWSIYLFITNSGWQRASKIISYKKLWKTVPSNWNIDSFVCRSNEITFFNENDIRFAGLLKVDFNSLLKAIEIVRDDFSCALCLSSKEDFMSDRNITKLYKAAFPLIKGREQEQIDWESLLLHLALKNDLAIRVSGSYDERCAALNFIGKQKIISSLIVSLRQHSSTLYF